MKTRLATSVSIIALAIAPTAYAADLGAPYAPGPVPYSWTGFYLGVNGGYATGTQGGQLETNPHWPTSGVPTTDPLFPNASNIGIHGGFGGGQVGYNWQIGHIVTGLETDFDWGSIKGSDLFDSLSVFGWQWNKTLTSKVDWFGTVRGRLGYDVGGFLPYVTGGFAYGHSTTDESVFQSAPCAGCSYNSGIGSFAETRVGWTAGAGLEYALSNNWSMKAEYLHVDLGKKNSTFNGSILNPNGTVNSAFPSWTQDGFNSNLKLDTVKAGINYKF